MNKKILSTLLISLFTITSTVSFAMSKSEHSAEKNVISSKVKAAKTACDSLSANAKDICMVEAKGAEKIEKAELEARYNPKAKNQNDLRMAKADVAHDIAKEKCDDKAGNDKDVCVKEAKAVHTKAKSDAAVSKTVKAAVTDSAVDRTNADYKVAVEKCNAQTGDAKNVCVTNAKTKYNKT